VFPDPSCQLVINADAPGVAIGCAVFFMGRGLRVDDVDDLSDKNLLQNRFGVLCFYRWRMMKESERCYLTIEKEILASVEGFKIYGYNFRSTKLPIVVVTDHANIVQLEKFKVLQGRHVSWMEELSGYLLEISFSRGVRNTMVDRLSRPCGLIAKKLVSVNKNLFKYASILTLDGLELKQKMKSIHEARSYALPGVSATLELLERSGKVLGAQNMVESVVRNCVCCQINKMRNGARTS
jgi:RNase H-like domain found in reverse transcriptase